VQLFRELEVLGFDLFLSGGGSQLQDLKRLGYFAEGEA
jgi:hypothetical protein